MRGNAVEHIGQQANIRNCQSSTAYVCRERWPKFLNYIKKARGKKKKLKCQYLNLI